MDKFTANRRDVLRAAASLSLASALPGLSGIAGAQTATRPNIVFILADDLGYADLSSYGRRDYTTPHLDQLAADGVRLTQGYANSCVCSATRIALITGRYQYRLPVGLEEPINDTLTETNDAYRLPTGHPTLPSLLRGLGYRTALVGKWHIGASAAASPTLFGYDHFFGLTGGGLSYYPLPAASPWPDELEENGNPVEWNGYLTDVLGDEAVRWIGNGAPDPFFLSLHFTAPHAPWTAPGDVQHALTLVDAYDRNRGSLETYAQIVGSLDQNVGKVLDALDRLNLANDTIVVFTSDNGGERYSDTWPFTGVKGELLEGGIRVPLIVRWPGRIAADSTSEQVMTSMDFLPTLLAAAGGAPDPAFPSDGEDLLPVLAGVESVRPRTLFWRHKAGDQAAVRDGDWKYLRLGGKEHLFNLANDPRERANLALDQSGLPPLLRTEHPALLAALRTEHEAWNQTMLPYPDDSYSFDPRTLYGDRY